MKKASGVNRTHDLLILRLQAQPLCYNLYSLPDKKFCFSDSEDEETGEFPPNDKTLNDKTLNGMAPIDLKSEEPKNLLVMTLDVPTDFGNFPETKFPARFEPFPDPKPLRVFENWNPRKYLLNFCLFLPIVSGNRTQTGGQLNIFCP